MWKYRSTVWMVIIWKNCTLRLSETDFIETDVEVGRLNVSLHTEWIWELCNTYIRVKIEGERGRKIAVLLKDEIKEISRSFFQQREKTEDFWRLFSKPGDSKFLYRGSDCQRRFAKKAILQNATAIASNRLRKQLETLAQKLNLKKTSQNILAVF